MRGMSETVRHEGGCHCGRVRWVVTTPAPPAPPEALVVHECNCSICAKAGYLHLLVEREQFELLRGEEALSEYTFGTGAARHLFCRVCGIKSFYVPRSNPNGYSVNARCIDSDTIASLTVKPFDGRNWDDAFEAMRSNREE